jgi:hypothetical protein
MERPDLFQDDLTEERYPSPARREDEAQTQTLDPDESADDANDEARAIRPEDARAESGPGGPDDDEDEDDEEDDEDDDD